MITYLIFLLLFQIDEARAAATELSEKEKKDVIPPKPEDGVSKDASST